MSGCSANCRHPDHHNAQTPASSTGPPAETLGDLVAQQKVDAEEAAIAAEIASRYPRNRAGRRAAERHIARAIVEHRTSDGRRRTSRQAPVVAATAAAIRGEQFRTLPMPDVVPAWRPWWRVVLERLLRRAASR